MIQRTSGTILLFFLVFQFVGGSAHAFLSFRGPHNVGLGPEIYFVQRKKGGGSNMRGFLYGGRLNYDRIRRSALYWGGHVQAAYGTLHGHNSGHDQLKSRKYDSEIEGRFGYTWKKICKTTFWMTPYLGVGRFEGTNRFVSPSPLEYKITNTLPYLATGFLWRVKIKPFFSLGLNFKAKYSVDARSIITDDPDPEVNNSRMYIDDRFSYDLDLPFYFTTCCSGKKIETSVVPFYRYRHYGHHENHPFDFIDTRFHMYGFRVICSVFF